MSFFSHATYMPNFSKKRNNNVRPPINIVLNRSNPFSFNVICSKGIKSSLATISLKGLFFKEWFKQ